MWKNILQPNRPQTADYNIIWHSGYLALVAFSRQRCLRERTSHCRSCYRLYRTFLFHNKRLFSGWWLCAIYS